MSVWYMSSFYSVYPTSLKVSIVRYLLWMSTPFNASLVTLVITVQELLKGSRIMEKCHLTCYTHSTFMTEKLIVR